MLAPSIILLALGAGFELPEDVRDRWARRAGVFPASPNDAAAAVAGAADVASTAEAIRRLTQLQFDHGDGNDWLAELAYDLEREELATDAAALWPATVELNRVELDSGVELVGSGRPLGVAVPVFDAASSEGITTMDPNVGLDGEGRLWIAREGVRAVGRVEVPTPRAVLVRRFDESIDAQGRLVVHGEWFRAGRGVAVEAVALDAVRVTLGNTLFANDELGLRTLRRTHDFPALLAAHGLDGAIAETLGVTAPLFEDRTPPQKLVELIDALHRRAPDVQWPAPFVPDPAFTAAAWERRDALVDPQDAATSLLRLRFALVYGGALDDAARTDPRALLDIERRVAAALAGRPIGLVEQAAPDHDVVRTLLRRVPIWEPAPPPDLDGAEFLLPSDASPWRQVPLLVALHGQGGAPEHEVHAWSALCDRAGVALLCPRYGSSRGASQDRASDERLLETIRTVLRTQNVDPERVALTGISMGGAKTWYLASSYPALFAAAVPEIRNPSHVEGRFPLLSNTFDLPMVALEGELDGRNTLFSRSAAKVRAKGAATFHHFEFGLSGHVRMGFAYPEVLAWMLRQRRDGHPRRLEHRAFHVHKGSHAWLTIDDVRRRHGWTREDGAYVLQEMAGVRATFAGGAVTLRKTAGSPSRVTIHHDGAFMGDVVRIRGSGRTIRWKPEPSVRRMIDEVRRSGDRTRAYGDAVTVELR